MTSEVTLTKLINIRAPGVTVQTGPITKESTDFISKEDHKQSLIDEGAIQHQSDNGEKVILKKFIDKAHLVLEPQSLKSIEPQ
jgi:hypothetical protein